MHRIAALGLLLVALPSAASDHYLGTITSAGTSVTNGTTATPFSITAGAKISIQCDGTAYILSRQASSATVTTANGVKLLVDQLFDVDLRNDEKFMAMISGSGTVNCKVWARIP